MVKSLHLIPESMKRLGEMTFRSVKGGADGTEQRA